AEQPALDRRAGAGERQERHRDMRVLDRERERGAQLVAVERAVARLAHPARAEPCPLGEVFRRAVLLAGAVALEGRAAGAEIFAARSEAAETEALIRERHRTVRIALACRNRVAEAGDQEIAHCDLRRGA